MGGGDKVGEAHRLLLETFIIDGAESLGGVTVTATIVIT